MGDNISDKKSIFKKWLETLQQESWQLELLISGLALLGVFSAKDFIDGLEGYFATQFIRGAASFGVEIFLFLLKGSWYIFLINLLFHIILRGLWIGAIGLRYVSEDIDYEKLKFSKYFEKLYTRRYQSFDDYIEDLERICSVIFAYTFLLFFILISACLFIVWPIVIVALVDQFVGTFIVMIYLVLGLIVFVDFIFLNPLKKVKEQWFARIYGVLFRFYSTITLSFIFRPLLLNFLDNKFTKKLFLFSIPYGIIIILVLPNLTSESLSYFPSFTEGGMRYRAYNSGSLNPYLYDDLMPDDNHEINHISLKNHRIEGAVIEFFLKHFKSDEVYFKDVKGLNRINRLGVYSSLRNRASQDSSLMKLTDDHVSQRLDFLNDKKNNRASRTDFEWDSLYNDLEYKQKLVEREVHVKEVSRINEAFKGLCTFSIDGIDITKDVECFLSEHSNLGEKGWKCFSTLDSLSNGVHILQIERGIYRSKIKVLSPIILEIPFILDKS